ncbi:MAG: ABC transporter substrate-binding protein [Pseudomonadota bacterium]|nr:ABC transporter substrate-binding protein [Pseudomonadota bacterium]
MNTISIRLLIVGALALIASAGTAAQPVKIGFHAGLTGAAAADGNAALAAAKIAVDQTNASGGINGRQVVLVVYDDQGKPEQVALLASRLISDDKVRGVVSAGFSPPTRAGAPIFQKAGMPYIAAISSAPEVTQAGNYVFRVASVGEVQGRAGAKVVGDMMHKKRAVVLTIKVDFGKTIVAGFKEMAPKFGVDIIKEYEYSPAERQFGPMIAGIKADNPDVIYATGFYFTGGPLVRQIRAAGITVPIVGAEALSSQKFIEIAGSDAEGVLITNVIDWGSTKPEVVAFLAEFEKRTSQKAEAVAAQSHAAVMVLLDALRRTSSEDPEKLRSALEKTDLSTAIGKVSFNRQHEVRKAFPLSIVRNGSWQAYGIVDDMVLLAPPEH